LQAPKWNNSPFPSSASITERKYRDMVRAQQVMALKIEHLRRAVSATVGKQNRYSRRQSSYSRERKAANRAKKQRGGRKD
jgi:hypothetical protein